MSHLRPTQQGRRRRSLGPPRTGTSRTTRRRSRPRTRRRLRPRCCPTTRRATWRAGSTFVHRLSDTEITHLHEIVVSEQHIAGTDVAMDDARCVRGGDCGKDLARHTVETLERQRTITEFGGERADRKTLHHQERDTSVLTAIEDHHNIWLRKSSGGASFGLEPAPRDCLLRKVGSMSSRARSRWSSR